MLPPVPVAVMASPAPTLIVTVSPEVSVTVT